MNKFKKVNKSSKSKKKKAKANRLLAVIIVLIMIVSTSIPIVAFAATGRVEEEIALLQEGEFALPDPQTVSATYSSSSASLENQEVQDYIYSKLMSCSKSFSIYSYKVNINAFRDIYCNVINDNPDLFYVSSSVNYSYYKSTGCVATIYPEYSAAKEEIEQSKAIFEEGAQKALAVVDDKMSDLQKALVLHDYICDLATYPADAVSNDKELYHSAYGFFYDNKTVCAGYALTYSYLLHRLGIECEYVTSTAMRHAWNSVKIDGYWYNVDLTYDDISFYNSNMNVRGGMFHRCFMKSNEALGSALGFYHYGGTTLDGCDMTNTRFDDYFWNDVNTNIYVIDGDYYYLDVNSTEKSDILVKRTQQGEETMVGNTKFSYAAVSATGKYQDQDGVTQSVKIYDPLCRLTYLDNRFYITHGKYLISYAPMNGKYSMQIIYVDEANNLMGIAADENGNLICQRRGDYLNFTLDKVEYFNNYITTANSSQYNNYADINLDHVVNAKDYALIVRSK